MEITELFDVVAWVVFSLPFAFVISFLIASHYQEDDEE